MSDTHDDELVARLRAADPAASLPPADPGRTARPLEETMSHDVDTDLPDSDLAARRRSPLTWLVAAAAVLVIVGVGAFALFFQEDNHQAPTATHPQPSVLALQARPPVAGRCAPVSATTLANQDTAFDGTVTSITDGVVTLEVGHWYRGGDADQVAVQATPANPHALVQAAHFQVGQRYLASPNRGFVTVCGLTAPYSDDLAAMYSEAFGG